ncbi:hypothetical protein EYZ11_004510 [Aspergillus tanneri]|uniref:Uncharacterized protein n=1 Tax=Aspergillus tanneri TaxID=1220188 RepID=A0A4S3JR91_9EURO|nr:uncharacterized protein ATNIH1004_011490 [Aspergillus tanneri]KAA8642545.1 hypothetical protein ATNIH1004_011490 [Aspergillus tanneri]THC96011.1 hypothetical protein EYZ11_004510 [Aspergillus tanneri]
MSLMQRTGRGFPFLNRALDEFDTFLRRPSTATDVFNYSPLFDVRETKDKYYLDVDVPGVEKKDINIQFSDPNTLQIKGHSEHDKSEEDPEHSWLYSERSVGDFRRSFCFPSPVDDDRVQATLKNGVLSITVPKAGEPSSTKTIEIE